MRPPSCFDFSEGKNYLCSVDPFFTYIIICSFICSVNKTFVRVIGSCLFRLFLQPKTGLYFFPTKVFFWDWSKVHKVAKMKVQKRVPFSEICQKLNLFKLNPRSSIFWCWSSLLVGLSRTLDFWEGRLADLSKTWEKLLLDSLLVISHSSTHSISLWSLFQGELSAQGSKPLTHDKHFQTVGSYNYHHEKHTAKLILFDTRSPTSRLRPFW